MQANKDLVMFSNVNLAEKYLELISLYQKEQDKTILEDIAYVARQLRDCNFLLPNDNILETLYMATQLEHNSDYFSNWEISCNKSDYYTLAIHEYPLIRIGAGKKNDAKLHFNKYRDLSSFEIENSSEKLFYKVYIHNIFWSNIQSLKKIYTQVDAYNDWISGKASTL